MRIILAIIFAMCGMYLASFLLICWRVARP